MKKICFMGLILYLGCAAWMLPADTLQTDGDPWTGWRTAYEHYDKATAFKASGQYQQALEHYDLCIQYFEMLRKNYPNWHKDIIRRRIELYSAEREEVKRKLESSGGARTSSAPAAPATPAPAVPVAPAAPATPAAPVSGAQSSAGNRLYIEMQTEIDQYRRKLRDALAEIDALQIKLQQSEAQSRNMDAVLHDYRQLQDKFALLEMQYRDLQSRSTGGDAARFEAQLSELKIANDDAMRRIRLLESDLRAKDEEYALSRNEVLQLRAEMQRLAQENRRLQRELELQRGRVASSGNNRELEEKIRTLEAELKRKDQRIERLMQLLGDSSNDGSTVVTALNGEIRELQAEIAQLRQGSGMESELRRRISDLTANESSLQKQLADFAEQLRRLNEDLRNLQGEKEQLLQQLSDRTNEVKVQQHRLAAQEAELKRLSENYAALEKRYQDRLQSESVNSGKMQSAREDAEKARLAAEAALREKSDALAAVSSELAAAEALVAESRNAVLTLTAQVHSLEAALQAMNELQRAYDELKAKFDLISSAADSDVLTALNRIPALEETIRRYEAENKRLLAELAAIRNNSSAAQAAGTGGSLAAAENTAAAAAQSRVESLLAEGRSAANRGNYEIAIWSYQQVLAREPGNPEATGSLGLIYLTNGKFDEAVELLTPAVQADKNNEDLVCALARAWIGKRDYEKALALLLDFKSSRNGRASAGMLLAEAVAYVRSGNNEKAENAFRVVLQLEPGNAEAAYELALLLSMDQARLQEAAEFYKTARANGVRIDPHLEDVLNKFSGVDTATRDFMLESLVEALAAKDLAGAQWYYEEVSKLAPSDPKVKLYGYVCDIFGNKNAEVVKALSNASTSAESFLKALSLMNSNEHTQAEAIIKELPRLKKGELPEALLKKYIAEAAGKASGNVKTLWEALLNKLP